MNQLIQSSTDFRSVRDGRNAPDFYFDIDLSSARNISAGTALIVNVAGNSFYCDANPGDGNAVVKFQDTNLDRVSTPFYVSPGFIAKIPFTQMLIENTAQPGKKIRIAYGVDVEFQPGSVAQIAVSNVGGYTAARPEAQTGFFSDTSVIVANTPLTIFTPAANVNGAVLLSADGSFYDNLSSSSAVFISKSSAPASIIDGSILVGSKLAFNGTAQTGHALTLPCPQYISAGQGLYYISNTAQGAATNNYRACRYKLL